MSNRSWIKHAPVAITVTVIIGAIVASFFLKDLFHKEDVEQKKRIQQITVITPPPPPPPPPPEEIKQPDLQEEQVVEDTPEESAPDEGPDESVGEELGLDADGSAGSDSFGLVAKKGGRGLLSGGNYAAAIKAELNKAIIKDHELSHLEYRAIVTVWINDDGSFFRYDVEIVDGKNSTKEKLERFLADLGGIDKPKPFEEKSTRFKFRISSVI